MRTTRERRDFYFWRWHLILRGYGDNPQYGCLLWGRNLTPTFDIWFHQTLITLRWLPRWDR